MNASAASHYVEYDPVSGTYSITPEQAFVLALDNTPVHLPGAYHIVASCMKDTDKLIATFRTGNGLGWHEHDKGLFEGAERFFRPNYRAHLTTNWIPALDGVEEKLRKGAKVADVGCGHGASTLLMAKEYPNSRFFGFDYHESSILRARAQAEAESLSVICVPASLSQEVGLGLGAQVGEKRMSEVVKAGGSSRFRRASETPFNLVFEARL